MNCAVRETPPATSQMWTLFWSSFDMAAMVQGICFISVHSGCIRSNGCVIGNLRLQTHAKALPHSTGQQREVGLKQPSQTWCFQLSLQRGIFLRSSVPSAAKKTLTNCIGNKKWKYVIFKQTLIKLLSSDTVLFVLSNYNMFICCPLLLHVDHQRLLWNSKH